MSVDTTIIKQILEKVMPEYYYDPTEYREYITALLSEPLVAGETYYYEYYVALHSNSTVATAEMQIHFSAGVPLDQSFPPPGPYALTPHVQSAVTPTSTFYQPISGCFVATGGEDAMTFGNFNDNANTNLTTVSATGQVNSYYYLDNVSLFHMDSTLSTTNDTIWANMAGASYQWVDCDNGNASINGETNQYFTPTAAGNYAVVITMGGCSITSACVLIDIFGVEELSNGPKKLIQIVDLMGRETTYKPNTPLIYIYDDGSRERVFRLEL